MAPKTAAVKAAPDSGTPSRKRKSKTRTEVLDESSSDESSDTSDTSSPSEDSSSAGEEDDVPVPNQSTLKPHQVATEAQAESTGNSPEPAAQTKSAGAGQDDFSAFYLRSVASEFAEDLDKIRSANDFNEGKMPLLIRALKQGEVIFSDEEKRVVMQGTKS